MNFVFIAPDSVRLISLFSLFFVVHLRHVLFSTSSDCRNLTSNLSIGSTFLHVEHHLWPSSTADGFNAPILVGLVGGVAVAWLFSTFWSMVRTENPTASIALFLNFGFFLLPLM